MQRQAQLLEKIGPRMFNLYYIALFLIFPTLVFAYAGLLAWIRIKHDPLMALFYVGIGVLQWSICMRAWAKSREVLRNHRRNRIAARRAASAGLAQPAQAAQA